LAGDLTARAISCALDPACERPEERDFDVNLHEEVPRRRAELAVAALTIVRAYLAAGEPRVQLSNFARFEDWTRLVRRPLFWLGMDDPCKGRERIEARDDVRAQLTPLLEAWRENYPGEAATASEAIKLATRDPAPGESEVDTERRQRLREAMQEVATKGSVIDSRLLGNFIAEFENRIEAGLRFRRAGKAHQATRWRVIGELGELREFVSSRTREMSDGDDERDDAFAERLGKISPHSPNSPNGPIERAFSAAALEDEAELMIRGGQP
jgi:hypothetical protein